MDWYLMVWRKYAEFGGRSRRKEYWMFVLFNALALLVLVAIGGAGIAMSEDYGGILFVPLGLYVLAALIPSLAVLVRRFHDTGKSGWLLLLFIVLGMIPIVGIIVAIVQLVFLCTDSDPGVNQYGPNPKFPEQAVGVFAGNPDFSTLGLSPQPQPPTGEIGSGFCKSCGARMDGGATFCSKCGAHV